MRVAHGRLIKITYTNKRGTKLTEIADTSKHAYLDVDPVSSPWEWAQQWVTQFQRGTALWGILISDDQLGKYLFAMREQRIPIVGELWQCGDVIVEVMAVENRQFARAEAEKQMIQTRSLEHKKCFTWHSLPKFLHSYCPKRGEA